MSDLQAIKPEKLKILQDIIEGIKTGRLSHVQEAYHCGSSHCIAGWIEVYALDAMRLSTDFNTAGNWIEPGVSREVSPLIEEYCNRYHLYPCEAIYVFARDYIGLNSDEACILFTENASFPFQEELVNLLAEGYRVPGYASSLHFEYEPDGSLYINWEGSRIESVLTEPQELRAIAVKNFPRFEVSSDLGNATEDCTLTK